MCTSTDNDDENVSIDAKHVEPENKAKRPGSPLEKASFISKLLFMWPYPLLKLGMTRPLEESDLPEVMEVDSSAANRRYLEKLWEEEKREHPDNPMLQRAIIKDYFTSLWYVQPLYMIGAVAKVAQAVALGLLIEAFQKGKDTGWLWASVIVAGGTALLIEHHHSFFITWRKGMRLRIAAIAAIYYKSQRLSSTHQDTSASYGRIMNLASNDVERFLLSSLFICHLIWAPLQSFAILYVGLTLMGPAFAAGFALLFVVFVPLQFYLSRRFIYFRGKIAAITDKRVNFVSQAVCGARLMKMSGFESQFLDRILDFRQRETNQIARANRLKAWNEALFFCSNVVISVVIFLVHVGSGNHLTSRDVFTTYTLINIIQIEMTKHVSLGIMGVSEAFVSIRRIQNFLEFPELPDAADREKPKPVVLPDRQPGERAISLLNVTCNWNEVVELGEATGILESSNQSESVAALADITLDFHSGQLTCLVGPVGSGKSALLQALISELPIYAGKLERRFNSLAYAAQDPWIMGGTVKENITMGLEFDPEWYDKVVNCCGLDIDFKQLRDGGSTIVGDRGVQVSGGQRARIGLARALYKDADVLIADDPLSAVDAKVGRQLFNDAILGLAVNRGKCVVLATHQHQHIGDHRCVLVLRGGIGCIGTYEECVAASNGKLTAHGKDDAIDALDDGNRGVPTDDGVEKGETINLEKAYSEGFKKGQEGQEMNEKGILKLETYLNFLRAMGGLWVGVFLAFVFTATQASALVTIAMVGKWAEQAADEQKSWDMLVLIMGLSCLVVLLAIFRALYTFQMTITASRTLHDNMADSVLRSKVEFFDTNPLGRILNRFSADVGSSDDLLPQTLFDFLVIAFIVLGAVATTLSVLPFAFIAFPPLAWYFFSVRRIFVTSTRELKRLEGLARSPIFAMLSESLGGIATIRSNHTLEYFRQKFEEAHDSHTRAFFAFIAASRWVGFRMDGIMMLFLSLVAYLAVLFQQEGWFNVDPSILGLSLSMLLQLAGMFQWCIRQSAEVVNQMVSVERVLAFGNLDSEAPLHKEVDGQLAKWPQHGSVDFNEVSVRYRSTLPLALNKATFHIPGGARVGVVGRTGSGKSTIVQTLFRLLETEHGCICIDGVDISELGLHALRTKISVIPQTPTLFSGCSVRENLDLFNTHSDSEIQKALDHAHLGDVIRKLPNGWNSMVSEGGTNFSVGQRQLLCLARAILSNNKILILDEATASVDRRTDELLQEALQESFKDGTIIAVAHRLETIIEYDFVLVLGHGHVLEFGSPAKLLSDGGAFASMVNDTGDTMSAELRRRAFRKQKESAVMRQFHSEAVLADGIEVRLQSLGTGDMK